MSCAQGGPSPQEHRPCGPAPSSLCSAATEQPSEGGGVSTVPAVLLVRRWSPGEEGGQLAFHPSRAWDACQCAFVLWCWVHTPGRELGASDTGARQQGIGGGCNILFPGQRWQRCQLRVCSRWLSHRCFLRFDSGCGWTVARLGSYSFLSLFLQPSQKFWELRNSLSVNCFCA